MDRQKRTETDTKTHTNEQPNSLPQLASLDGTLGTLLEIEYFLSKILVHLVNDGLHECRRVCKKWYEVCNKLPLKIRPLEDKIPVAVEKFPNAVDVFASVRFNCSANESTSLQDEAISLLELHENSLIPPLLSYLTKFSQLEALAIEFYYEECMIGYSDVSRASELSLAAYHQMFKRLRSLKVWCPEKEESCYFLSQLPLFTGLTLLEMFRDSRSSPSVEPFTELKRIENLNVPWMLTNAEGQLLFPELTNLTHLNFSEKATTLERYNGGILDMLLPYASSLQSISISSGSQRGSVLANNWALKVAYVNLKAMYIGHCDKFSLPDVCNVVQLNGLTHLSMNEWPCDVGRLMEVLYLLTALKSLHLNDIPCRCDFSAFLSRLKLLTQLHLKSVPVYTRPSLCCLTGLKELMLDTYDRLDWNTILCCMPHLERFRFRSRNRNDPVSNLCLSQLKMLEWLSLTRVKLESNFFSAIGALQKLTELALCDCSGIDRIALSEVNNLTALQSLCLYQSTTLNPCSYIQKGKLVRIRTLHLPTCVMTEQVKKELFVRLPSLRLLESAEF